MPTPRQPVPALAVPTLDHGAFELSAETPERGTIVVFYRGLHCPICANYLTELEKLTPEFEARGYRTIAISADGADRARAMADKIGADALRIGYDLPLAAAREWGLSISASRGVTSIGVEESALFSEPGLFIVDPEGKLYYGAWQTMPFARPHFRELLSAVDFAIKNDYPARGEYTGPV